MLRRGEQLVSQGIPEGMIVKVLQMEFPDEAPMEDNRLNEDQIQQMGEELYGQNK